MNLDLDRALVVSNMGDDSISVIDINNRRERCRISLVPFQDRYGKPGSLIRRPMMGPHSIKLDKSRENLYVVNCFDDSISVIDTKSWTMKENFFAGNHPNDMVFNIDESYIYVTNGDSDSVSIIDTSSRRIIAQVSVGIMPHGICISPDGEFIYTANMDSGSISIIDTWSNSKVSCIRVGKCPVEVRTSADGRFLYAVCSYLGNDRNGEIAIISASNLRILKNIEVGKIPVQIWQARDGRHIYVTNMGSNDLSIIDLNRFEVAGKINYAGNMPRGIVMDDEGRIFITSSEENTVNIIKQGASIIEYFIGTGKEPTSILYTCRAIQ